MSSNHTEATVRHAIAANVRAEVARAGYGKGDLAAQVFRGARMNAWRRLAGEVPFSGAELVRIANWLGIAITDLITAEVMALAVNREQAAA